MGIRKNQFDDEMDYMFIPVNPLEFGSVEEGIEFKKAMNIPLDTYELMVDEKQRFFEEYFTNNNRKRFIKEDKEVKIEFTEGEFATGLEAQEHIYNDQLGTQFVKNKILPAYQDAKNTVYHVWSRSKHHYNFDWNSFITDVVVSTYENINRFKMIDDTYLDFDWAQLNISRSDENIQLHKYLTTALKRDIDKITTEMKGIKRTTLNGYTAYKKTGFWDKSLDQLDEQATDADCSIHDVIGEEKSVTYVQGNKTDYDYVENKVDKNEIKEDIYHDTHFKKWFKENMGTLKTDKYGNIIYRLNERGNPIPEFDNKGFLTAKQLEFYYKMKDWNNSAAFHEIYKGDSYIDELEDEKHAKYPEGINSQMVTDYYAAIRKRALDRYLAEFPNGEPRFCTYDKVKDIELLNEFIDVVNESEIEYIEENVMNWIRENWNETVVAHIVNDNLTSSELYEVNGSIAYRGKVKVSMPTIDKLIQCTIDKFNEIQNWDLISHDKKLRLPAEIREDNKVSDEQIQQNLRRSRESDKGYVVLKYNKEGMFVLMDEIEEKEHLKLNIQLYKDSTEPEYKLRKEECDKPEEEYFKSVKENLDTLHKLHKKEQEKIHNIVTEDIEIYDDELDDMENDLKIVEVE